VKSKLFSNSLAFVLVTLMLFKVSALHVYTHQDNASEDIENCEICELAVENQQAAYLITPPQQVHTDVLNFNTKKQTAFYFRTHASSLFRFSLYGRPPPVQV